MSSTIFGSHDGSEWHVPNEIFWTVLERGARLSTELARSETEAAWVRSLELKLDYQRNSDSPIQTYSPDIVVDDLFAGGEEMAFWSDMFLELALRERRRTCDPADEHAVARSVKLLWAIYGLAKFLRHEARVRGAMPAW